MTPRSTLGRLLFGLGLLVIVNGCDVTSPEALQQPARESTAAPAAACSDSFDAVKTRAKQLGLRPDTFVWGSR